MVHRLKVREKLLRKLSILDSMSESDYSLSGEVKSLDVVARMLQNWQWKFLFTSVNMISYGGSFTVAVITHFQSKLLNSKKCKWNSEAINT